MILDALIEAKRREDCLISPPSGLPAISSLLTLPQDLKLFLDHCGGCKFHVGTEKEIAISGPKNLLSANIEIAGCDEHIDDPSMAWFVIARSGLDKVVIDLSAGARQGLCYDGFWDRYGVIGQMPIVALSFTEFVSKCLTSNSSCLYWHDARFGSYGDAYLGLDSSGAGF